MFDTKEKMFASGLNGESLWLSMFSMLPSVSGNARSQPISSMRYFIRGKLPLKRAQCSGV